MVQTHWGEILRFFYSFFFHPFLRCVLASLKESLSVGPSVMLSSKSMKNGILRILNDLDSAGLGGRRDEEDGVTRRKEGRGGRRKGRKEGRGE